MPKTAGPSNYRENDRRKPQKLPSGEMADVDARSDDVHVDPEKPAPEDNFEELKKLLRSVK